MVRTKPTARARMISSNVAMDVALSSVGVVMVGWIVSMIQMKLLSYVQTLNANRMHSDAIIKGSFKVTLKQH